VTGFLSLLEVDDFLCCQTSSAVSCFTSPWCNRLLSRRSFWCSSSRTISTSNLPPAQPTDKRPIHRNRSGTKARMSPHSIPAIQKKKRWRGTMHRHLLKIWVFPDPGWPKLSVTSVHSSQKPAAKTGRKETDRLTNSPSIVVVLVQSPILQSWTQWSKEEFFCYKLKWKGAMSAKSAQ